MSDFQRAVGEWADATFTASTPASIVAHLRREVDELSGAQMPPLVESGVPDLREEAADCYLLLLHLAHKLGFDLAECAGVKFALNKGRRWGTPAAEGVVEHVREGA